MTSFREFFFRLTAVGATVAAGMLSALLFASVAVAQDGPDYWQVFDVPPGDVLNLRTAPGASNRIVATAKNGRIFRNRGCQGLGSARWCKIETPDGRMSAWASGRYLRESGAPTAVTTPSTKPSQAGVPELAVRSSGEIEVRWVAGCTVLYNPAGHRINAGSSCTHSQRVRSDDAVARHFREQGGNETESGAAFNMRGFGNVTLGGRLNGQIVSKNGRSYALILSAPQDGFTCTGSFDEAPGTRETMSTTIHCTNGSTGSAILKGKLLTFSAGGKGGLVRFN